MPTDTPAPSDRRRFVAAVLGGWLFTVLILLAISAPDIAALRFPDADDAMRMIEVRDWLAGQGWFDVAQHRLNGGDFPMHWSRLVDIPLAATILALRPLLGAGAADHVAAVLVPMLTLLATMALIASITRRVAGMTPVPLAVLMVAFAPPLLAQMRPLRIDHHGWQIVLTLVAVRALLAAPSWRTGALAGAALGALLTISLEGLPIAAAVAGIAVLDWAWRPVDARAPALAAALFVTAALLQAATRGPAMWAPACDAMAPGWIAALGGAAAGVLLALAVARLGLAARLAALALGGALAAGAVAWLSPACLSGPFATLPPRVFRYWYVLVLEGRPLWEQEIDWAAVTIGLPVMGLIGAVRARALTVDPDARARWTLLIALQGAAFAIAIMVNRAGGTANALAVPGAATLLLALLTRARAIEHAGPRIMATVGAFLLASPGQIASLLTLVAVTKGAAAEAGLASHRRPCANAADIATVGALPTATLFAPIDATPALLAATPHRAIAGGYHRGAAAIDIVIHGFTAAPGDAKAIVLATRAEYLVACPGMNEMELYRTVAPNGLWARLERGERIAWLRPVPVKGPALAWRVIRPLQGPPANP